MFIILLSYLKPMAEVELFLEEHKLFLQRHFARGGFLLAGRKVPRTGGFILGRAPSLEAMQAIIAEDPFHREGVAAFEIIETAPTMAAPALEFLGLV